MPEDTLDPPVGRLGEQQRGNEHGPRASSVSEKHGHEREQCEREARPPRVVQAYTHTIVRICKQVTNYSYERAT